jgi:hypothetical protein
VAGVQGTRKRPYNAIGTFEYLQGLTEYLVPDADWQSPKIKLKSENYTNKGRQVIRHGSAKPCKIDVYVTLERNPNGLPVAVQNANPDENHGA